MSLNWRKPLVIGLLRLTNSFVPGELQLLRSIEWEQPENIRELLTRRLVELLRHAWVNTEYYKAVLEDCGAVRDGVVNLECFEDIPCLTKDIIRKEGERLRSKSLPSGCNPYRNSTGGSTGQPLSFWQDSRYWDVNVASKIYHFEVLGKQLGEPEMKIWGSDKDLFEGTIGLKAKLQNLFYNREFAQCFHMNEESIRAIIHQIDTYKPKLIWSYRDGMDEVAKYVKRHHLQPHAPAAIVCLGGTLYPHIAERIREAFDSPVINAYGSREMGDIGFECLNTEGLHISAHSHHLEAVDEIGTPVMEQEGELVVTSLMNYAMPFIRYRIGDRGKLTARACSCGRGFPLLETVSGRMIERFVTATGEHVDPIYFVHLMGVVYGNDAIKRFQVIQEDYLKIRINIILEPGAHSTHVQPTLDRVSEKIRLVMGQECEVIYDFVEDIALTKSGKYLYVISKVAPSAVSGEPAGPAKPSGTLQG
jgi:phenylacetate-CoA ligase